MKVKDKLYLVVAFILIATFFTPLLYFTPGDAVKAVGSGILAAGVGVALLLYFYLRLGHPAIIEIAFHLIASLSAWALIILGILNSESIVTIVQLVVVVLIILVVAIWFVREDLQEVFQGVSDAEKS